MHRSLLPSFVLSLVAGAALAQSFEGIGDLPGGRDIPGGDTQSYVLGISDDGSTVVGVGVSELGREGVVYDVAEGALVGIGTLRDGFIGSTVRVSELHDTTADGALAFGGSITGIRGGFLTAALFDTTTGSLQALPTFVHRPYYVRGCSANGSRLTGRATNASGFPEAFYYDTATGDFRNLSALGFAPYLHTASGISADGSTVVGDADTFPNNVRQTHGAYYDVAANLVVLIDDADGLRSRTARAASADGSTIVGSALPDGTDAPVAARFDRDLGVLESLGTLTGNATRAEAQAVSADGSTIVGWSESPDGLVGFHYTEQDGLRTLEQLADDLGIDTKGWQLRAARAVSADGLVIAGDGIHPDGHPEGWVMTLPEPRSGLAALHSLVALAALSTRRRSRRGRRAGRPAMGAATGTPAQGGVGDRRRAQP